MSELYWRLVEANYSNPELAEQYILSHVHNETCDTMSMKDIELLFL
jgi:hypothetical protein